MIQNHVSGIVIKYFLSHIVPKQTNKQTSSQKNVRTHIF